MKHYEKVEVPAKIETRLVKTTCNMCGREIKTEGYSAEKVEVMHRIGSSYPEGGSGEITRVDMCGKCFDEKLIPWLQSQGAEPRTDEWDW